MEKNRETEINGLIMVVDDDPFILRYISEYLSGKGYIVAGFEKTADALERLRQDKIEVVLSDIRMPEISGIDLIEKVHAYDPDIPVILMTAFADFDTAVSAIKKGAFDFILKPFDPEYLIHSLSKALKYKRFLQIEKAYKKKIEDMNVEVLNLNLELEHIVAERTISMLGLKIADRIRNPVTVIGGICRQIIKKTSDEYIIDGLNSILEECLKMEMIVSEFDSLVKERRAFFKREDLREIILSVTNILEKKIKEKNITITIRLPENPLIFNANKELIKIAVRHLLNNSIESIIGKGQITISASQENDSILLTIEDTGRGISQEDLKNIFEPFYKTKDIHLTGLSLVKQIVSEHLGDITIESILDKGTTIKIIFPVRWKERVSLQN